MADLKAEADRLSAALCQPNWRPSRAHVEQARNQMRQAADEIERLQEAKRRALNVADERSKENVKLRRVCDSLLDALRSIAKDGSSNVEASVFAANVVRHYDNVEITADRT